MVMRRYWLGRTIVSAVVAGVVGLAAVAMGLPMVPTLVAVTFVGGYIPYIGAFIGGLLGGGRGDRRERPRCRRR